MAARETFSSWEIHGSGFLVRVSSPKVGLWAVVWYTAEIGVELVGNIALVCQRSDIIILDGYDFIPSMKDFSSKVKEMSVLTP